MKEKTLVKLERDRFSTKNEGLSKNIMQLEEKLLKDENNPNQVENPNELLKQKE